MQIPETSKVMRLYSLRAESYLLTYVLPTYLKSGLYSYNCIPLTREQD